MRAVVPLASANPAPGRTHDPSWGIWPCTELKSQTTCERATTGRPTVEVSTKIDNGAALALGTRPSLFNSMSSRYVTVAYAYIVY